MNSKVENIRKKYPEGTRIELMAMDDISAPPAGTRGTVLMVDDMGDLIVDWDNGSSLNLVPGVDSFRIVSSDRLVIAMPRSLVTDAVLEKIKVITKSKEGLFKRAFGVDSLDIQQDLEKVSFVWFPYTTNADEIEAYGTFINRLCLMASAQKRAIVKNADTTNDRYSFRAFLLRLGLVGDEYRACRKMLSRNLTGNSAFRNR